MRIPSFIKYFLPALLVLGFFEMGFNAFLRYLEAQNSLSAANYQQSLFADYTNRHEPIASSLPKVKINPLSASIKEEVMPEPEAINFETYKKLVVGRQVFEVEVALTESEKENGLSGRKELEGNKGMLFIFDKKYNYSFWMKDMKMPLDFIWIAGNKVVQIDRNIDPQYFAPPRFIEPMEPVDAVLEVGAGISEAKGIKVGDIVDFRF
jgi:uncharacterized membrane protein (UPF0127 family)